jgi:hypothetical protein
MPSSLSQPALSWFKKLWLAEKQPGFTAHMSPSFAGFVVAGSKVESVRDKTVLIVNRGSSPQLHRHRCFGTLALGLVELVVPRGNFLSSGAAFGFAAESCLGFGISSHMTAGISKTC